MSFFSDFSTGVSTHIKAWRFIAQHRLWHYFLYPVFLLVILAFAGFYSIWNLSDVIVNDLFKRFFSTDIHTAYEWLDKVIAVLIWIIKFAAGFVIRLFLIAIVLRIARYVVLILCSPMMAKLSERVEEIVSGNTYPFDFGQFIKDIFRGIAVNLRNLFFEMLIVGLLLIVGWIPVIGWFTLPFLWMVGWYFLGFNMMDYTYERRRMSVSQGAAYTRKHKGIAIGNGMVFSFLLLLPWIGLIVAPVLSSVAGTLATLESLEKK